MYNLTHPLSCDRLHNTAATPKNPAPINAPSPTTTDPAPLLPDEADAAAADVAELAAEPAAPFALLTAALAALVAELTIELAEIRAEDLAAPVSVLALEAMDDARDSALETTEEA